MNSQEKHISIYTDGSSRGNPGPGGYGAVIGFDAGILADHDYVYEIGGHDAHTTNNRMELMGVIASLRAVHEEVKKAGRNVTVVVTVHTDSAYVLGGIGSWVAGWEKNGWKTANKKPVLNQELWQPLMVLVRSFGKNLHTKKVAGHSGVLLNERADVIATSFADKDNTPLFRGTKENYKEFFKGLPPM